MSRCGLCSIETSATCLLRGPVVLLATSGRQPMLCDRMYGDSHFKWTSVHLNDAGVMVVLADLSEAAMFCTVASYNSHLSFTIVCIFMSWRGCHILTSIR